MILSKPQFSANNPKAMAKLASQLRQRASNLAQKAQGLDESEHDLYSNRKGRVETNARHFDDSNQTGFETQETLSFDPETRELQRYKRNHVSYTVSENGERQEQRFKLELAYDGNASIEGPEGDTLNLTSYVSGSWDEKNLDSGDKSSLQFGLSTSDGNVDRVFLSERQSNRFGKSENGFEGFIQATERPGSTFESALV